MRTSAVTHTRPPGPKFALHMKSLNVTRSVWLLRVIPGPPAAFWIGVRSIAVHSAPDTRYRPGWVAATMLAVGTAGVGDSPAVGLASAGVPGATPAGSDGAAAVVAGSLVAPAANGSVVGWLAAWVPATSR